MSLITKTIKIRMNGNNKKWYESLGYIFENKKEIEIPIKDLTKGSHEFVRVACDYCGESKDITYKDYYKSVNAKEVKKYCCSDCQAQKQKEILEFKNNNNLLTNKDNGYWTFRENRIKELGLYIKKNKIIEDTNDKDFCKIYDSLSRYKEALWECVSELGYDPSEVVRCRRVGMYDNYEVVEKEIKSFIDEFHRFPRQEDFRYELRISDFQVAKHGGADELKRKIGYIDDGDLVDKNNYNNASLGEYLIAQFLINNNIEYNRDVVIDKKSGRYNCDFVLKLENNELIWVEYWGGLKNADTVFSDYKETYKKKMKIYKNVNKRLLSIYPIMFENTLDIIGYELENIFSPYIKQPDNTKAS